MSCAGFLVLNHGQVVHVTLEGGVLTCETSKHVNDEDPHASEDHDDLLTIQSHTEFSHNRTNPFPPTCSLQLSKSVMGDEPFDHRRERRGNLNGHGDGEHAHGALAALVSMLGRGLRAFHHHHDAKPSPFMNPNAIEPERTPEQEDGQEATQDTAPMIINYQHLLSHRYQLRRRQVTNRQVTSLCLTGLTVEVVDKEQQVRTFGGLPHSFQVRTLDRVHDPKRDQVDYEVIQSVWFSASNLRAKKMWMHKIGNWHRLGWSDFVHVDDQECDRQFLVATLASRSSGGQVDVQPNAIKRTVTNCLQNTLMTSPNCSTLSTCPSSGSSRSTSSASHSKSNSKMFGSLRHPVVKQRSLPDPKPSLSNPQFGLTRSHSKRRFYRSTTFGTHEAVGGSLTSGSDDKKSVKPSWFQTRVTHSYVVHTEDPIVAAAS